MLKLGIMSIGFPNFRVDIAQKNLEDSLSFFAKLPVETVIEEKVLVTEEDIIAAADRMKGSCIDALVLELGTYSYGSVIQAMLERLPGVHIILWGVREPIADPDKAIPLNTLCALNMYGSFFKRIGFKNFSYCYGDIDEEKTVIKLSSIVKALSLGKRLRRSRIAVVGGRVPGFYLSNVDELRFRSLIGPEIVSCSLASLIADANRFSQEEVAESLEGFTQCCAVSAAADAVERSGRIYLALKKFAAENHIDGFALRCWPELQELYNISACGIIARMNQEGMLVSCEGDVTGLATMMILSEFSENPVMLVDLVNISREGIVKVWHCGCGSPAIAGSEPKFESHPTMSDCPGLATSFNLKTGHISLCKLSEDQQYRMLIMDGRCVEPDRRVRGNQGDLKFPFSGDKMLETVMDEGIEHHYCLSYNTDFAALREYCRIFNIREIKIEGGD